MAVGHGVWGRAKYSIEIACFSSVLDSRPLHKVSCGNLGERFWRHRRKL